MHNNFHVLMTVLSALFVVSLIAGKIQERLQRKPKNKDRRIRIAIDESIGQAKIGQLRNMGYNVVCIAGHAEPDVDWLNRAFANGALFVISPDLDIPNIIERENYPMIWIDYLHIPVDNNGGRAWTQYVDKRIKDKTKFLKNQFGPAQENGVKFTGRKK